MGKYYLNEIGNPKESEEHQVVRVFGGNSSLEGGYVTNENPGDPIWAKNSLGLSWHDFKNEEGETTRNWANQIAIGTVETDDENNIVLRSGKRTDHPFEFTTVPPQTDVSGGGQQLKLQDPFSEVVEVKNIQPLVIEPTDGWKAYIEAEDKFLQQQDETTSDEGSANVETPATNETSTGTDSLSVDSSSKSEPSSTDSDSSSVDSSSESETSSTDSDSSSVDSSSESETPSTDSDSSSVDSSSESETSSTDSDSSSVDSSSESEPSSTDSESSSVDSSSESEPSSTDSDSSDND